MRSLAPFLLLLSLPAAADPILYTGGPHDVSIRKTALDPAGNLYTVGSRLVSVGAYTARTVFVAKIDPAGTTAYTMLWGGKGDDIATGIALDSAGRTFIAGYTTSPDFPLLHPVQTEPAPTGTTAFLFALDPTGIPLWSTYWGGTAQQRGFRGAAINAIATDAAGGIYVTGTSDLQNFPTTPGAFQTDGRFNIVAREISPAFVTRFSPAGQVIYSTWLGGGLINCRQMVCFSNSPRLDVGASIAVDAAGSAYILGYTDSQDFPVTPGAYRTACDCLGMFQSYIAFLAKLKPDGSALAYSTFLDKMTAEQAPPPDPSAVVLALGPGGEAYAAFSNLTKDVALLTLNPSGTALTTDATLGGAGADYPLAIALAGSRIYLSGATASPDFPDTLGEFPAGADFLAELDPDGHILTSLRLPGGSAARDLLPDPAAQTLIAAGDSGRILRLTALAAEALPPLLGAGNAANGTIDSALVPGELVSVYGIGIGPAIPVAATPEPRSGSLIAAQYPFTLAGLQVTFNGTPAAIVHASRNRIDVVVPSALASPLDVAIGTIGPTVIAAYTTLPKPGIFQNPEGTAAALNQNGTLNSESNPAHPGEYITIWGTGIPNLQDWPDGGIPAYVNDHTAAGDVSVFGPTRELQVAYAGGAPGLIGAVFQINAKLPDTASLLFTIHLQVNGIKSPTLPIHVSNSND